MSQVFHPIEKSIISILKKDVSLSEQDIAAKTGLSIDQTRRGIEWLKLKGLANVTETESSFVSLGKNGISAKKDGLPERKLANLVNAGPLSFDELRRKLSNEINIAIANAKKK